MKDLKRCSTCGRIKVSNPTPGGDEVCPSCGDKEMIDYEFQPENEFGSPTLQEIKDKANEIAGSWNGDEAGYLEERAMIANEILEKLKELEELLKEINL